MKISKVIFKCIVAVSIIAGAIYLCNNVYSVIGKISFDKEFEQYMQTKSETDYYKLLYTLNSLDIDYEVTISKVDTKYFNYTLDNGKVQIESDTTNYLLCKTMENQRTLDDGYEFITNDKEYVVKNEYNSRNLTFDGKNYYYSSGVVYNIMAALTILLAGVFDFLIIVLL